MTTVSAFCIVNDVSLSYPCEITHAFSFITNHEMLYKVIFLSFYSQATHACFLSLFTGICVSIIGDKLFSQVIYLSAQSIPTHDPIRGYTSVLTGLDSHE